MAQIWDKFGFEISPETKIMGLTFWLQFGFLNTETEPKFGFRTSLVFICGYKSNKLSILVYGSVS